MKIFHGIMYAILMTVAIIGFNFHPIHVIHSVEYATVEVPVAQPDTSLNQGELDCLAKNIYFEARNQSFVGRMMVGLVTIERTKNPNFPDTICKVVYQGKQWKGRYIKNKCQFSWVCDGKADHVNLKNVVDQKAWKECQSVAEMLMKHTDDIDGNKLVNYHADYVTPRWSKSKQFQRTMKVGDHIFYRLASR